MKAKYIYKCLLISFAALLLGSCNSTEVDSKFDQNATERLSGRQKELNDLLLSSAEGWKAVYYTDSTQLGAWTHLFKFLPDGTVDMASDFDAGTATQKSQYEIQLGSTTSLVFTTKNKIHLLSDAANYPTEALKAKGYLGDFQFLYYGQKDGNIIFKTNRNGHEVRFVKATAQDWTDLPKKTPVIKAITGNELSPLFRLLEVNDGTTVQKYDFDYNTNARFGSATSLAAGSNDVLNLALAFTPTGATVKPALVVKGQKLTKFDYDSTTNTFIATGTGGVTATIKYTNTPPRLTDDYIGTMSGQPFSRYSYQADDTTKDASTNSDLFNSELAKINKGLPLGVKIKDIDIYYNSNVGSFIYYTFDGTSITFLHRVTVQEDAVGKKVILKSGTWNTITGTAPNYLKDFDNYLVDAMGVYVKKESFKLTYTNAIYTFTAAGSPFRMTTYKLN